MTDKEWPMVPGRFRPPPNVTHYVRGYNWKGQLLVESWNVGEGSMQMEVSAWERRMRAGEVSRIEIDKVANGVRTLDRTLKPDDVKMTPRHKRRHIAGGLVMANDAVLKFLDDPAVEGALIEALDDGSGNSTPLCDTSTVLNVLRQLACRTDISRDRAAPNDGSASTVQD